MIQKAKAVVAQSATTLLLALATLCFMLAVYACSSTGSSVPVKAVTPDQVLCLINRQDAIVECVRANKDKPSIDACLAVAEGKHCEADAVLADAGTSTQDAGADQ